MAEIVGIMGASPRWLDRFASLCEQMPAREAKRQLVAEMEGDPQGREELADMRQFAENQRKARRAVPADVQAMLERQRAARYEALKSGKVRE